MWELLSIRPGARGPVWCLMGLATPSLAPRHRCIAAQWWGTPMLLVSSNTSRSPNLCSIPVIHYSSAQPFSHWRFEPALQDGCVLFLYPTGWTYALHSNGSTAQSTGLHGSVGSQSASQFCVPYGLWSSQLSQIPAHPLVGTLACCILQSKTLLHTLVVWAGMPNSSPLGHRLQLEQGCHEQLFLFFPLCPCCSHLQNLAHAFPRQNHTGTGKMSFLQSSPSLQPQSIVEVVSSLVQWLKADLEVNLCCFF